MAIAIAVTFLSIGNLSTSLIFCNNFFSYWRSNWYVCAFKIPIAAAELVAGFHSLVGLAAVFVAISAFLNPQAFNLRVSGKLN